MKKIIISFCFVALISITSTAQTWPSSVTGITTLANDSVVTEGNLSNGKIISDLRWATSSAVACFTTSQFHRYQGNHVFYGITIKPGSIVKVKAKPANNTEEISLYGYMMDKNDYHMVPALEQCITCEADYKRDKPMKGKVLTDEREIEFRNPTTETYNIIIGVAAPKGITERKFSLIIKTVI
jgi:hypothetical protein